MGDSQETTKVYICRPIYRTDEFIETYQIKERSQPWHIKMKHFLQKSCHCSKQKMVQMFPFINVILTYQIKSFVFSDLIAGVTVGFMQLPQGMAYAMLSGLPPVIGLYMGFFPIVCYCLLGTSKHLSMGAIVVVCLMIGALMEERFPKEEGDNSALAATSVLNDSLSVIISQNNTRPNFAEHLVAEKIKFAMAITIVCGITQILMCVIQLGAIVRLMSDAIISAFSTGVAIHVITSQLKYLLGIQVPRFSGVLSVPKTLLATAVRIPNSNYPELLLSLTVMVVIYLVKTQINERYKSHLRVPVPIDLIMVVFATVISYYLKLTEKYGFLVVGDIPAGLPTPAIPDFSYVTGYVTQSVVIAMVAFAQSISVTVLFARKEGYEIDANKELFAYGIANVIGPFFSCFTTAGALSRTSVQLASGGKTQVASLFGALFVLLVILVAGPLLKPLPNCVLSTIILVSLRPMLKEILKLKHIWKVCHYDCILWIVTFLAVVLTSLELGLVIGICFGVFTVVVRTQRVQAISLGVIDKMEIFKDKKKYSGIALMPGVTVIAFPSPLYYANVDVFQTKIRKQFDFHKNKSKQSYANQKPKNEETAIQTISDIDSNLSKEMANHHIIIDCSAICFIDGMGAKAMKQLYLDSKEAGVSCLFSCTNDCVISVLKESGAFESLRQSMYLTTYDALMAVNSEYEDTNKMT